MNISKWNHQIELLQGGTFPMTRQFMVSCLRKIQRETFREKELGVVSHENGHFNIAVTGRNIYNSEAVEPKIQALLWTGITSLEVIDALNQLSRKHGLII